MNETMQTIFHRRSIRRFDEKQVEEDALQEILRAGLYAPSAGGRQGVIFVVCQTKEINERLGKSSGQIPIPVWRRRQAMYPENSQVSLTTRICKMPFTTRRRSLPCLLRKISFFPGRIAPLPPKI